MLCIIKSCLFLGTKEAIFALFFFKKGIFEWLLLGLHSKSNVVFQIRPYSWPIFHLQCCTHNQIGYSPRYALITFLLGHILHCTLKPQNARKTNETPDNKILVVLLLLFVLGFSKEIALKGPKIVEIKNCSANLTVAKKKSNYLLQNNFFFKFQLASLALPNTEFLERLYWTGIFKTFLLPKANADYVHFLQFYL